MKKTTLMIIIIMTFFSKCGKNNEVKQVEMNGKKNNITIEQFDSFENEPIKRANLINELDKESRWKFFKKMIFGLKLFQPPFFYVFFFNDEKLLILNESSGLFTMGIWKIDKSTLSIEIVENKHKQINDFPRFSKIVFEDCFFTVEKIGERTKNEKTLFKINFNIKEVFPLSLKEQWKKEGWIDNNGVGSHGFYYEASNYAKSIKDFCNKDGNIYYCRKNGLSE